MFRFITLSQASSGWSSAGAPQVAPALLTRMSTLPKRAAAAATVCCTDASSPASQRCQNTARPPSFSSAFAVSRSTDSVVPQMASSAPSRYRRSLIARPMPRPPPVTSATWPVSLSVMVGSSSARWWNRASSPVVCGSTLGVPTVGARAARADGYTRRRTRTPTPWAATIAPHACRFTRTGTAPSMT